MHVKIIDVIIDYNNRCKPIRIREIKKKKKNRKSISKEVKQYIERLFKHNKLIENRYTCAKLFN